VGDDSPTLTKEEFRALIAINTDNAQTTGQTITVPDSVKKIFTAHNNSGFDLTIQQGTTSFVLATGDRAMFFTSGVANNLSKLFGITAAAAGVSLVMRPQFPIADPINKLVYQRVLHDNFTLLSVANGLNAQAYVNTPPSANMALTLRKNGSSIGTVDILSGQNTGTFTVASDVSFVAGDRFDIIVATANAVGFNYALAIELT
jgi:hypothetical protein